jgi:hypothetical protein
MPVSPLGNVVVVNQMTPAASSIPNAHNNRIDIQNLAAQTAANEKKIEIEELRPTEENHSINPDREHQRQEADEETDKQQKEPHLTMEDTLEETNIPLHKLDIKV